MLLGGLWHGAARNFVLWGFFHGAWLALHRVATAGRPNRPTSRLVTALSIIGTFVLTVVGWVIFRAHSGDDIASILTRSNFTPTEWSGRLGWRLFVFWLPLVVVDVIQERRGDLLAFAKLPLVSRSFTHAALFCAILAFGSRTGREFLYFQF